MFDFAIIKFTWTNFLLMVLVFAVLYFLLQFTKRLLQQFSFFGRYQASLQKVVEFLLLVFEPLAVIVLVSVFTLINPILHGLIVALLLLTGFTHVRNYLSGRILLANRNFSIGERLRSGHSEGVIFNMERLGLNLQTNEGLHHLSYSSLLTDGYTLLSGEEIGGFYHFLITPKEEKEKVNHVIYLRDQLATTPFIDWNHLPELFESEEVPNQINTSLSLREESHLHEFMALVKEWGYSIKLLTEN